MYPIITIDGTAAAGKGTLAKKISRLYNFAHLESGLLYRALAYQMIKTGAKPKDKLIMESAKSMKFSDLKNPKLRDDKVAKTASIVAKNPKVRKLLVVFQRNFGTNPPKNAKGSVIDGRDIGTIVFPNTPYKIFITANLEKRAMRRHKELQERGIRSIYGDVLKDLKMRDMRDKKRKIAPLKMAKGAYLIDSSDMLIEDVFKKGISWLKEQGLQPGIK